MNFGMDVMYAVGNNIQCLRRRLVYIPSYLVRTFHLVLFSRGTALDFGALQIFQEFGPIPLKEWVLVGSPGTARVNLLKVV